jgi:hypothetical protein
MNYCNDGRLLSRSSGFVRARCAGWRHGTSVQISRHSAMASSRVVSRGTYCRTFDGGVVGGLGLELGERPPRWMA